MGNGGSQLGGDLMPDEYFGDTLSSWLTGADEEHWRKMSCTQEEEEVPG